MRDAIVIVTLFCFIWTPTLAIAGQHDEGIAAGKAANTVILGTINQTSASTVVPGYTATPPETAYRGQAKLPTLGNAHLADCATRVNDPVCEAQRGAVLSANTPRPAITAYDPAVVSAKDIARNPSLVLGSLAAYYSGCSTSEVIKPASMESRLCKRTSGVETVRCGRTLTIAIDRKTSCTPGDWFAHAIDGTNGFDAQCVPDRPETAQHFRITQDGNPVAYFDADLTVDRLLPHPVVDLGPASDSAMSGSPPHKWLWFVDNACTGTNCTVTALIAPDRFDACTGEVGAPPSSCLSVAPFSPRYAACPAGQLNGGNIRAIAQNCSDCEPSGATLNDSLCYAPATQAAIATGTAMTGNFGSTVDWTPVSARPTQGWDINPAFPVPIPRMTLSYAKPVSQSTEKDQWDDQCPAPAADSRCTLTSADICIEGPATKRIDGREISRACWKTERTLSCAGNAPINECAPLAASGCMPASSSCIQMNPATGICDAFQDTYQCPVQAQTTTSANNCPSNVFCLGTSCFNTAYSNDTDFARSMTLLEAAREAGVYLDTDRMQVFKGEANNCRDRLLKNCCAADSAGAGMTNQSMFGVGSRLVYDVLMNADNRDFIYQGVQALLAGSGFNGSFTSYGVTVAVNGTALPAGSVTLYAGDSLVLAFDPWSLAIAVVFYIVMSMMSCSEEEGKLALKEGARLCHTVGDWCSSCIRLFGKCVSCIEQTTAKCCFNSVLSRLVNEQGRQQVGKNWGSAERLDCSGFSIAQLQSLDFATMDLTEFYISIVPSMPNVAALRSTNAARVTAIVAHPSVTRPSAVPSATPSPRPPGPTPVPTPGPPRTPAPTNDLVSPVGQDPARFTSSFAEEFENGLNPALWNDTIWFEAANATKSYAVEDGVLKIWPQRDANGRFFNRTIDTDGKYYQTYGYFEIEAKLPVGRGTWPAFWLFNHIGARRPEIDIMEAYAGGGPGTGWGDSNLHPVAYGATIWKDAGSQAGFKMVRTPDLSAGFHQFGLKWEPNKQTFYFDGKEVYSANVSMSDPMYLMLDLWFGSASGSPDASTPTGKSNSYEVNYLRAWKFK